jgi:hypothetical protein
MAFTAISTPKASIGLRANRLVDALDAALLSDC